MRSIQFFYAKTIGHNKQRHRHRHLNLLFEIEKKKKKRERKRIINLLITKIYKIIGLD